MGFLSGSVTFECFRVRGAGSDPFGPKHIKTLERYAIGQIESASPDEPIAGFLAGDHLFDQEFSLEKNVIGDALHCAIRIDTNQIPSAIRKAWLQMELAALSAANDGRRLTKFQRQEARETVQTRCEEEARSGRFRRMQQFPVLWDARNDLLFFGGSSPKAVDHCRELFAQTFELELSRLTAGRRAEEWAAAAKQRKALEDVSPSSFHAKPTATITWWNGEADNFDFLGNEFLLWLWWRWEAQSDTLALPDDSEVTGMLARSLRVECPEGESGKATITAESPVQLPEATLAIRSGKLPRKAGLILVRHGQQYELALQAEMFSVGGARIQRQEAADGRGAVEDRIESVRELHETLSLLYAAFCHERVGKAWSGELEQIRRWLKGETAARRKATA